MRRLPVLVAVFACVLLASLNSPAADWPQFRYDTGRTAASPESLPADLHLQWLRTLPCPRPAFPGEIRLRYDATYEPVVAGKTMFVPSMVADVVTAYDTDDGRVRWQFFAEGPVRFAPAVHDGKVYFVSDDGYLYCVGANDGKLLWKFRGAPEGKPDRKIMGNGRLVSLFPARGGPLVAGGVVYFAAGIWSGEGVFVHALDANTGRPIWSNTDSHHIEMANMDHGISYFAGISPQGYLAIVDGKLVVPCGAQLPAVFDLKTGKLGTYTMGWGGRVGLAKGCWFAAGVRNYLLHGGDLYDIRRPNDERFRNSRGGRDYKRMLYLGGLTRLQIDRTNQKGLGNFRRPVLTPEAMYYNDGAIVAFDLTQGKVQERAGSEIPNHRRSDQYPDKLRGVFAELWRLPSEATVHIKAGRRLYCGRPNAVEAVDLPEEGNKPQINWKAEIQGTPHSMIAADGKLFVVTTEGRIYAFGEKKRAEPLVYVPLVSVDAPGDPLPTGRDSWTAAAAHVLETSNTNAGYALVLGLGSGRWVEEIVRQSRCNVVVVDADAEKVTKFRRKFHQAGLYGTRFAILVGDPATYPLPPYFASLIICQDPAALGNHPGKVLAGTLSHCLRPYGGTACLALPDDARAELTEAISANRSAEITIRQSGDYLLATRGGALPESDDWSHGGANAANTGASQDRSVKPPLARLWFDGAFRWHRQPGKSLVRIAGGRLFVHTGKLHAIDVYTGRHLWQADMAASPPSEETMVATEDAIYLAAGRSCAVLDPATGKKTRDLKLPDDVAAPCSIIRVAGDSLFGACGNSLVCINRHTGKLIWKRQRQNRIGGLAVGNGKVFRADYVQPKRGERPPDVAIEALDAKTGKSLWQATGGRQIRYYQPGDLLCTSSGILKGRDGSRAGNAAVALIAGDRLVSGGPEQVVIRDPKNPDGTGKVLQWTRRGCTLLRASANLLTTRYMGNAAYIDLATGRITSIWNVRAACSNNLFVADGVLALPNLSGGCTCNYMPVSQAFVPAPVIGR